MKRALAAIAVAGLAGCAATATVEAPAISEVPALRSVVLENPGFEIESAAPQRCPPLWWCTSHSDPNSYRFVVDDRQVASGKRSLCIERVTNEPWATVTQSLRNATLKGTRVRYSIAIRIEGSVEGAGPWMMIHHRNGNFHHDERLVKATRGWQRMSLEFAVPEFTEVLEVGVTLMGPGRVCLDDARLEVVQEEKKPV